MKKDKNKLIGASKSKENKDVPKEHLKILAIGDLHGDTRQVERLAEKAVKEKVDFVVISGDLTTPDQATDYLVGPFAKRHVKVLIIPGNHDLLATTNFLESAYRPDVRNIHGKGIQSHHVGIFGAGGANIGLFQISDREMYDTLKKGFDQVHSAYKKIMVTHVHPSETLMEKLTTIFPGSDAIRKAIEKFQPDIAICSHVHEAEGIEEKIGKTRVINVGKKGKIIEI